MPSARPWNDAERVARLASYAILDSAPDPRFDRITRLACDIFQHPIGIISLVGEDRVWLKSAIGIGSGALQRDAAICSHAILQTEPLIVPDALADPRFCDLPVVCDVPHVRAYAGVALRDSEGFHLGALAVMDTNTCIFRQEDAARLADLAALAVDALEAHRFAAIARSQQEAMERARSVLAVNEQLGRIIDNSINEVYILDPGSLRVLETNTRAQLNLGYGGDALKAMTAPDLKAAMDGTPMDRAGLERLLAPLLAGDKKAVFCKDMHRRQDGSLYPTEGVVELSRFGDQPALVWIIADVSEKIETGRRLEESTRQLAISEQRFRRIYHDTPALVYSMTRDRRIIDASNAFIARLGYTREEIIGRYLRDLITEESERRTQSEILPQFWRDGFCKDIACQYVTRDGAVVDMEFSAMIFPQGNGPDDPVIHSVATDVTARNRAQFELAVRERQYRAVLNDTPGLLSRFLPDTVLTFANPRFCDLFGADGEAMIGQPLDSFMPAEERAVLHQHMAALSPDDAWQTFEQQTRDAAGNPVWLWWSMRGYFDDGGALAEIQFGGRDITPIKMLQVELAEKNRLLEQTNAELVRANESLNQFAYIASHDLQEPLRKISTFVSLLGHGVETGNDAEISLAMPVIIDSVHRARHLVSDILAYSRIVNGELSKQRLNLGAAVRDCLDIFSETIAETGATIVRQGLDVDILADRGQLNLLLHNLVSNALKYRSPDRPAMVTIAARTGLAGSGLEIEVSDNGIGIQPEYRHTIFEPFRRLHPRASYPGSGIGLAICRTVIERHGWRMSVESEPQRGSSFTISMPHESALLLAS